MVAVQEERKKKGRSAPIRPQNDAIFKRRKECIKKKTMELSVLCDVKAIAIVIGPDGKIETWPENSQEVLDLIKLYKDAEDKNGGKEVASTSMAESESGTEFLCFPSTSNSNQFEDQVRALAVDASEEFRAEIQAMPSTSNAREIEGWINWEGFDPIESLDTFQFEFDELMNTNWDCSASENHHQHHLRSMNQFRDLSHLEDFLFSQEY